MQQETATTRAPASVMQAAVHRSYGRPEVTTTVEQVPIPEVGKRDVLVQVCAAGVNWADWSMTMGMPYLMRLGYGLRAPRRIIRGTDIAGRVVRVGSQVTDHRPGDEVLGWCTSAFAEYASVPAGQLVPKPAGATFAQAAGLPNAGCTALQAMRDVGKVGGGDRVLINGASGGIGSLAVQIAKARGAEVTGVCSTPNLELVRSLGADHVIDYTREDFTEGSERYDVIFDIADRHTLAERRRVLTERGTLIPNSGVGGRWFGSVGRIFKAWTLSPFVRHKLRPFLSMTKKEDLLELTGLIEAGSLVPVVGSTFSLAEAGEAIAAAGSGHARGKVVIAVDAEGG